MPEPLQPTSETFFLALTAGLGRRQSLPPPPRRCVAVFTLRYTPVYDFTPALGANDSQLDLCIYVLCMVCMVYMVIYISAVVQGFREDFKSDLVIVQLAQPARPSRRVYFSWKTSTGICDALASPAPVMRCIVISDNASAMVCYAMLCKAMLCNDVMPLRALI